MMMPYINAELGFVSSVDERVQSRKEKKYDVLTTFITGFPWFDKSWTEITYVYNFFTDDNEDYIIKPIMKSKIVFGQLIKKDFKPKFFLD